MSCCGKAKKAGNIIKGTVGHAVEQLTGYRGGQSPHTAARIRTCRACEKNTWLKKSQYLKWLLDNGIDVLKNFDQLEKLPPLPKQETGNNLYCTICKCFIPGKARIDDEKCPLDKWEKITTTEPLMNTNFKG